ncbi:MAG: hypothetical protein H6819_05335 [Phycisphaerales bacterium]|nr:hypothetical protein [Phycisphaerales bacterium]MCB9854798.1 hypothetical protein [Phycisphaerales bacterium]MCB9863730.1 hypothetical protein [Phycisphaerales bacterium]
MKGRPSLFEVMNKAPETSGAAPRNPGKWWHRESGKAAEGPVQIVAEALTEEEAAEELAAQAAAVEDAVREKEVRDAERRAKREAKRAERAAMRAKAADFVKTRLALGDAAPIVERSGDRFVVSVNLTGCLIAASLLCVIFIAAYFAGRRAGANPGPRLIEAAAVTKPAEDGGHANRADRPISVATPGKTTPRRAPDLSGLTTGRGETRNAGSVRANQPATVLNRLPEQEPGAEKLNYLAIQWFDFAGRKRDEVLNDVRAVQQFLADKGVETVARKVGGGVNLFSRKGYLMADEQKTERQAFQREVAEYGRLYRRQGGQGLYEWTDCYFVSYGHATNGDPI